MSPSSVFSIANFDCTWSCCTWWWYRRWPWNFRVFRGIGTTTQAQLGLRLVRLLPKTLTHRFAGDGISRYRFL
ncbi:MAG: hypothetical protein F6K53_15250 [Moorea sp. SIO4A1]|uniref:hypothetical protein n=1 Tax=Moorena sp. SIO4A1 TaxID=2607835 RepID=UPI00144B813E|nr:hypothetical protein [Moorena sp. SIO4A1]NEQ58680.1 hypothetical protein [Moorena sp. SIO4A1]